MHQLYTTKIRSLEFSGSWLDAIGSPEPSGSWIIWGNPKNGKTRFALQLAKYLCTLGLRVAYDSLEEGVSKSMRDAIMDCNLQEVSRRFTLLDKEPVTDLMDRLTRKKSPDVVIIDSIQYSGLSYAAYKSMKDKFRRKLFILVSHAEGTKPAGRVASSIRYDANVAIWVEGYTAYPAGRYGGGEPYTIWPEGAYNYTQPKNAVQ
jgi:hypothetical protein